jgi:tubulin epsilon
VSGAGNNFAHGHHVYGPQYADSILEAVREAAEMCDSLQSFFLMHSLGGGTGSGLGTYVLGLLEDTFPDVHRFVSAVFPSPDDDVVTSPYNSMLALHQVRTHKHTHARTHAHTNAQTQQPAGDGARVPLGRRVGRGPNICLT